MKIRLSETLILAATRKAKTADMTFAKWASHIVPNCEEILKPLASESAITRSVFVPDSLRIFSPDQIRARVRAAVKDSDSWPYSTSRNILDTIISLELQMSGGKIRLTHEEAEKMHTDKIEKRRAELANLCQKRNKQKNDTQGRKGNGRAK